MSNSTYQSEANFVSAAIPYGGKKDYRQTEPIWSGEKQGPMS